MELIFHIFPQPCFFIVLGLLWGYVTLQIYHTKFRADCLKAQSLPIFEGLTCEKKYNILLCRTHVYFCRLNKHVCQMKMFVALYFIIN